MLLEQQPSATRAGDDFPPVEIRLQNILAKLQGVRKRAGDQYEAICPCHDDTRQSLGVTIGDDRRILINCSKGCPTPIIATTIGYSMRYLRPDGAPTYSDHFHAAQSSSGPGKIVATYDYRDAAGELVSQVVRFEPKDFRQRQPDGAGGWKWTIAGAKVVPYRLPDLAIADPLKTVYIVEGEKDADRLHSVGLLATCNAMGAAKSDGACKWKAEHSEYLRGRHVVIIPDNDNAGRDHANGVAKSLSGVAGSVKILQLDGLPEKGDVSDWFEMGNTAERLQQLASGAPSAEKKIEPIKLIPSSEFFTANYEREYLVEGVLTRGEPCIVGGRSKTLKTSITIDLVLALGTGGQFLGRFATKPCRVAMLSGESGDYTIQETARRIAAARGCDPIKANVFWAFELPCLGSDEDLAALEAALQANKIDVLVVDPVYLSLMGEATQGKLNASNLFDVGPLLMRISKLCKANGTTLILLHHCRKNSPNEKYDPPELEELSMSGFGEFARQWVLIGRREPYEFDGLHLLWITVGGSAGHSGCWALDVHEGQPGDPGGRQWHTALTSKHEIDGVDEAKREAAAGEKRDRRDDEQKAKLLKLLAAYPGGESGSLLRGKLKVGPPRFKELTCLLIDEGKVEQCKFEKNGRFENGFRLTEIREFSEFSESNLDSLANGRPVDRNPGRVDQSSGPVARSTDRSTEPTKSGVCNTPDSRAVGRASEPGVDGRPNDDESEPLVGLVGSGEPPACDHDWSFEPSEIRAGHFKQVCKRCKEFLGYVPASEVKR